MARLGVGAAAAPLVVMALNPAEAMGRGYHCGPIGAEYYRRNLDGTVTCQLCPRGERLSNGQFGFCRTRRNIGGELKTFASGQPCVLNVDPIEKNPLANVLPGASVLSIAHAGCNMRCLYCQNWEFSQQSAMETANIEFHSEEALSKGKEKRLAGVNFTYTEGTTHIEFNKRLAAEARRLGFRAFLCTNGYIQPGPLADFLQVVDAVTVTIKGMNPDFQSKCLAVADYSPVFETCKRIKASGKWIEAATLLVPGLNDSDDEIRRIAEWIARNLGTNTPWHLERFSPKYKMQDRPPTPAATLEKAHAIGRAAGLRFVMISNLAPHPANNTYCPRCNKPVIKRVGFKVIQNTLRNGRCPGCGALLPGIWS